MSLDFIYRRTKSRRFQISLMLNKYRCLDFRLDTNHQHICMLFIIQLMFMYPRNPSRISRYVLPLQTAWLACRPCKKGKKEKNNKHSRSSKLRCLNRVKRKKMIILDVSIESRGKKNRQFVLYFLHCLQVPLICSSSQLPLNQYWIYVVTNGGEMLRHFLVSIM